jgi:hypothetical protein
MESLCFSSRVSHQIPHQNTSHAKPFLAPRFSPSAESGPQTAGGRYPRKEEFAKERAVFVTAAQIRDGHVFFNDCSRLDSSKAKNLTKEWDVRVAIVEDVVRPILAWNLSDLLKDKSIRVDEPISLLAVLRSRISRSTQRDKPEFRAHRVYDASNHRASATACLS